MEPWENPALTDIFAKNHSKLSITEKRRNKSKYLTWNSVRLRLWRRPAYQTLSKALDLSSATALLALDLVKTVAILSDKKIRKSAIDRGKRKIKVLQ